MRAARAAPALLAALAAARVPHAHHFPAHRQRTIERVLGPSYAAAPAAAADAERVFRPTDYGGDPSGAADSGAALRAAIAAAVACNASSSGYTGRDLGGAIVDLAGGVFAVGETVHFPSGYANFGFGGGTLRALPGFAAGSTLLQFGDAADAKGKSVQNVDVFRLTLDGAGVVGAALAVDNGQYVNVGPAVLVYGFTTFGITMTGTGGGYIHHSWLGEVPPSRPHKDVLTATAISLDGDEHDCYVDDVIIYSGRIGVSSTNGANQIQGTHTWNLMTTSGGIGIIIHSGNGKVIDSYLDFNALVIVDPQSMIVSNNLFLAKANLVFQSGSRGTVSGLAVSGNRWWSEKNSAYKNDTIVVNGAFKSVSDTVIEGNIADSLWTMKGTRATRTVSAANTTSVTIDFSKDLVFDAPIAEASCSVSAWSVISHSVHWSAASLTVLLSDAMPHAEVTCTVDQSVRTHAAH